MSFVVLEGILPDLGDSDRDIEGVFFRIVEFLMKDMDDSVQEAGKIRPRVDLGHFNQERAGSEAMVEGIRNSSLKGGLNEATDRTTLAKLERSKYEGTLERLLKVMTGW